MAAIQCFIAETRKQLDDALRVRWKVFGEELGLLAARAASVPRENSGYDTLETTVHIVGYAGEEAVGTVRLLLPNPEVAGASGKRIGIDLESKFDLSDLERPGIHLAETTRFCLLRAFRSSGALVALYDELTCESMRRGVTHWVASANTETDSIEDAQIMYRVAERLGLLSRWFRVVPHPAPPRNEQPRFPFYSPEERRRAQWGNLEGLALPRTLLLFARRMGARFTGEPIYDSDFRMCSMPLVAPPGGRCMAECDAQRGSDRLRVEISQAEEERRVA